jgi:glycosyl transferase family 25
MNQQMLFQCNTDFKFIEGVDGSTSLETAALMKKYFSYMGVRNSYQPIEFDKSTIDISYKLKYNFKRQHINYGSLGLLQSSFLLLNEFVQSEQEHILILEDDVYTIQYLDKDLSINNELIKDKDLIYLGCHTSKHNIYSEKKQTIFVDVSNHPDLIYGTYSFIISKRLARYILDVGIDSILRLNLSWDLYLNYIRDIKKHQFTFFVYFKQIFIPNVIKQGGINPAEDISFYTKNMINLYDYYIPEVTNKHTNLQIINIMATHNERKFFDFVDKIVYINLSDRIDRKQNIEEQLSKYISTDKIHRFDAIKHSTGSIGCGLSHIAVLEMAIAENWNNVLIVEDDLKWTDSFISGHTILERIVKNHYDAIILGGTYVKSYKNSFKLISCNCALSYIVNKSYYVTLLECFRQAVDGLIKTNYKNMYAIDQAWKSLQNRDNWYVIKPNMCTQIANYSNIENVYKDYSLHFSVTDIEYEDPYKTPKLADTNLHSLVEKGVFHPPKFNFRFNP